LDFIGAAAGGLIFSRLLGMSENLDLIFKHGISWEMLTGSKTIVGGLIGGLIGVEFTKKLIGVKTSSGDLMTFPLILGIGLVVLVAF
jgi:phosphatidylglycerol:prolipoprotein diacylglycerol transferase